MPRRKRKEIVQVKIRLHASVLAQLEAAAKRSEHSFNAEAAIRLGKSFGEEAMFGGEAGRRWMHHLMTTFMLAGERHYRDYIRPKQTTDKADQHPDVALWINEPEAYQAAMRATIDALMFQQPELTLEKCLLQLKYQEGSIAAHFFTKATWEKTQ
jgi:hypothetical protein